jgi:hypothetical protein
VHLLLPGTNPQDTQISDLPNTFIDGLGLPSKATLQDIRKAIMSSRIAFGDYDVFFQVGHS